MSAASRAKRRQPELEITVLEKSEDVSYSACGMPYNIADPGKEIEALVVRPAQVFREKQGIDVKTGHRVTAIDPAGRRVSGTTSAGGDFDVAYDHLLIATGGSPLVPDLPGFDLPGVHVLKSLADGRRIKAFLKNHIVKRAVIIGMGYIGLEMCEALRTRSIETAMVKPGPVFLPWLQPDLADTVRAEVEARGVTVHAGHAVEKIEASAGGLEVICSDLALPADLVLVAMGLKPASGLARTAGLQTGVDDAIAVDRGLRTSEADIYAAGDCADAYHVVTGEKVWIPLALRANRAGWAVADNVCGEAVELDGVAGTAVFKVFDLEVARTGLTSAEAEKAGFRPESVTVKTRSRAHAHPGSTPIQVHMIGDKNSGRLLGVQMVGREGAAHRINAAAVALHNRMSVAAFSQTDLAYAPPFGPTWDPLLTAANQLLKKL
jgi:NADPH-dependent 2,4-dienoyl-CoA reductase/sulfur reductase-like enzyme